MPSYTGVHSTTTRGFWFTAPTGFIITGLRVPSSAGTGTQNIQVMRLNGTFPISSSSPSTNFTNLAYISNATNGVVQTTTIQVNAGDVIGIFGTAGTSCSEGAGAYNTTIGGQNVTLNQLEYSGAINSTSATSYFGVGQGGTGGIGRIEMYYNAVAPCSGVGNLAISNVNSFSVDVGWAAPSSTLGYEYALTFTPAPPTAGITPTTNTTASITGLTAATSYYFQVRRKCQQGNWSTWDTMSVKTLDSCNTPGYFHAPYIDSNMAHVTWGAVSTALFYQYVVDQTKNTPASNHPDIVNVPISQDTVRGLLEGTWYYIHIRTVCTGNDSSAWSLDSFYTPIHCRAPVVKITNISINQGVASWNNVRSAYQYEYAITKGTATPPTYGVPWKSTSYYLPYLNDGQTYYIHVRTVCLDGNIQYLSRWTSLAFITFPVGVKQVEQAQSLIDVYPNPVIENLHIKVKAAIDGNASIAISDISGRIVEFNAVDKSSIELPVAHLQSGIYFLKYTDNTKTETVRFIRQ